MTKKKKIGRPSKYGEKILIISEQYLEDYKSKGQEIPTVESLALRLKVNKKTLYEWNEKYPEFSNVLNKLHNLQHEQLLTNGLNGTYNSTIAKLILHKHGYSDKVEQSNDITSKGEAITSITREIIKK